MSSHSKKLPSLEESFNEISTVVDKMEHGDLTLEQSLNHFERGIKLIKHCQKVLEEAEQKVQILIQNNNQEEVLTILNDQEKTEGSKDNEDQL